MGLGERMGGGAGGVTRRIALTLATILGLVLAFVVGPIVLFTLALAGGSSRTIYERSISPDGWHDARVQFDDAGALSSFSRLVFVKHHWNTSDEPLLSCRAFWADGEQPVHLRWLDSDTLLITRGFAASDVRTATDRCGPIRIIVRPPTAVTPH
ncbi:MAG: hypothetical protein ABIQ19_02225 [Sphingomonas sp.]